MINPKTLLASIDTFQRNHRLLAFPIAVIKRYDEEKAGKQAALITYYAFLAAFPLLMLFITILGVIVSSNPDLRDEIVSTVFELFPALGNDLKNNVNAIKATGLALLLQSLVVLYGARGLASILQETFNNLWRVESDKRPGFAGDNLRSIGMMLAVGVGMIVGTAISYGLSSTLDLGIFGSVLINIVNLLVTFGLFLIVFRLGTSGSVVIGKLIIGAVIASLGTIIVQRLGGIIMSEQLPKLEGSYGSFALALGMLFWIYLQAQVILYALVITIVRMEKDWPKKLF